MILRQCVGGNIFGVAMKNILIPTDFSDNATNAIYYGLSLFGDEPCKFTLLNTFFIPFSSSEVAVSMNDITSENADRLFGQLLMQIRKRFPGKEFNIDTSFRIGDLAMSVADFIRKKKTDLIVMGTQGAGGFPGNVIGSRTTSVIELSECPVLVIPGGVKFRRPGKIIWAVDDSNLAGLSATPLLQIARKFKSKLLLLHVISEKEKNKALSTGTGAGPGKSWFNQQLKCI